MAFRVGVLRSVVAAGLLTLAAEAHAQSLDDAMDGSEEPTADVAAETALPPPSPVLPRLTIAIEDEAAPAPRRRRQPVSNGPVGLSAGGLRLFPALEVGGAYSSNVKQSSTDRKSAAGVRIAPSVRVESDWVRHALRASVQGDYTAYAGNKKNNTGSVSANTDLRLDIRRTTYVDLSASYTLSPVRPDDSGLIGGSEGTRLDHSFTASTALNQDFGPLTARLRADVERKIYGKETLNGGGERDNKDLNLWRPGAGLRLTYSAAPIIKPYVEVHYGRRYHDNKLNSAGENTNSGDLDLRLGASFDDEALWSGDIALTYLRRDYSDSALSKEQAFGVNGNLTWRPTELTSVVLGVSTSLSDTRVDSRSYGLTADVSQSVRDNVTLRGRGGITLDDRDRGTDKTYELGFGVDWQVAPEWALTAGYDATFLRAAVPDENYTEHRVMVGVTLRR